MNIYQKRIRAVKAKLKKCGPSALLLSSAPPAQKSRDDFYPYRQDSDFYYLTGSQAKDAALLVSAGEPPLLFAPPIDPVKVLWDGPAENIRSVAGRIGAKLIVTTDPLKDVLAKLHRIETLFFQNSPRSLSWRISSYLLEFASYQRGDYPLAFVHSDALLEEMRLHKDPTEVKLVEAAARVTEHALSSALKFVRPGRSELAIATAIQSGFKQSGCDEAFGTIVGTGPSAATLHYTSLTRKLRRDEMVLIDCGAHRQMYAGDITRVFPTSGKFTRQQRVLYDAVLNGQKRAIAKIRHGVLIKDVYNAAAREIIEALVELKVLKGRTEALLKKGAHKPYFPHGIGHGLGIDVHDIGRLRGNNEARLEAGMVFTVEPGVYFQKRVGAVAPCGIRIEDVVLVTSKGCRVLTKFPKEVEEVEELVAQSQQIPRA